MLQKTLIAGAFVTAIAVPAFAQSFIYDVNGVPLEYATTDHRGNDANAQAAPTAKHTTKMANAHRSAKSAYAQAPKATESESTDVIVSGQVVGRDPDPFIRQMLKEEFERGQP
jgi:hypothetical protein